MSTWRGALLLFKHDMRESFSSFIFIIIGLLYLAITLVPLIVNAFSTLESRPFHWGMDILFVTVLLTSLSALGGRMRWTGWLTTPFTQKILVWRSLPITSEQITIFRMLQVFVLAIVSQLLFYVAIVVGLYIFGAEIVWAKLILFAIFWFSVSMILHYVYMFFELGKSSAVYSIMYYSVAILQIIIIISLAIMGNRSLLLAIYMLPLSKLALYSGVAIAIGIIVYGVGWRIIAKKIRERSFIV